MKYHLISAALLAAAVVLETVGLAGSTVLLAGGVACEACFWIRLVQGRRR